MGRRAGTQGLVAADIDVSPSCISGLINWNRPITADTAVLRGQFFNMAPRFLMNLQIESMPKRHSCTDRWLFRPLRGTVSAREAHGKHKITI
jgi:plasmid maintenance system antidote protein VapI